MVNTVTNDRGETVAAEGAPGSLARVKVQCPALIERLTAFYYRSGSEYGKAIDRAIEIIREQGITSPLETDSILAATPYIGLRHVFGLDNQPNGEG